MSGTAPISQYAVFKPLELLGPDQAAKIVTASDVEDALRKRVAGLDLSDSYVSSVPFAEFHPANNEAPHPSRVPQEVFSILSKNPAVAEKVRRALLAEIARGGAIRWVGADPTLSLSDTVPPPYSVPVAPDADLFGTTDDARRLLRAMPPVFPEKLNGKSVNGTSVNVVIVDAGLDKTMFGPGRPGHYAGGWKLDPLGPGLPDPPYPGMARGNASLHAMMMAECVLAIAPEVRIFDFPMIPPPKIYDILSFVSAADRAYENLLQDIAWFRGNNWFPGPWILVNAWAVYDRRSEGSQLGDYTQNLAFGGKHWFIRQVEAAAAAGIDIVFCSGNCGQVCPDGRCGPDDYGPNRSIWGANAHRDVLTVGAVRVDGLWAGYSSEGEGAAGPNLNPQKPDLCAPAQFIGTSGLYPTNTGTSAASGIAAGVVAALRTRWPDQVAVTPAALRDKLTAAANQTAGAGWNRYLGHGILDAAKAYADMLAAFP
ncbi:MAG: S8 family serine peptidase [Acetobacteraceae bacterium]